MPKLQVSFTINTDYTGGADLPTVNVKVSDGVNEVVSTIDGNMMAGYLQDATAFTASVVRPAYKQCRMATNLAATFVPLQAVTVDEDTVESEVLAAKLDKIPD